MNRRTLLKSAAALAATNALGAAAPRPNILLILADDLTWHDIAPYGSRQVRTPHLSRLASEGMCMDGMFTSTAMCAPTRQQIYTGLWPVRNGAYPNHSRIHDGIRTLPQYFKESGYRIALAGKTHFGPPASYPFEYLGKPGADPDPADMKDVGTFMSRDRAQPFFLVLTSHQPHKPWNKGSPADYPPAKIRVPEYLVDCAATRTGLSQYFAEVSYLDRQVGAALDALNASGTAADTLVIFSSEQGTQTPFSKWTCYDHGLKTAFIARWPGKIAPGSRNPALAQYVDILPTLLEAAGLDAAGMNTGSRDSNGSTSFDGRSFLPVLSGKQSSHRDLLFGVHTTRGIIDGSECYPIRSARSNKHLYIRNLKADADFNNIVTQEPNGLYAAWLAEGKSNPAAAERARLYTRRPAEELYDVIADPNQLRNLAADPAGARAKQDLSRSLDRWMKQQGDQGIETEMKAKERQMRGREA